MPETAQLGREGVTVRAGAECIGFANHKNGIAASGDCENNSSPVICSHLLMEVERCPTG
jgi:hypothetical protein